MMYSWTLYACSLVNTIDEYRACADTHPVICHTVYLYRWYYILESILVDLSSRHGATDRRVMDFSFLKMRVSVSIVTHRAKRSHCYTARCISAMLVLASQFNGKIIDRVSRGLTVNILYLKYSVFNRYVYFGETSTSNRLYDHHRHCATPDAYVQNVHKVIGRIGMYTFDTLVIHFPQSFDRLANETALIRRFSCMNKYLMNARQRSHSIPGTKLAQIKHSLSLTTRASRPNNRQRLTMISKLRRPTPTHMNKMRASNIQTNRIPTVILFGGGYGGVTEGVARTKKYDIRGVYEYCNHAADTHRARFPSIPVCTLPLGGDIDVFIASFVKFIPRKQWSSCYIQASPPCRMLSLANAHTYSTVESMAMVEWTFRILDLISPAIYVVENVPAMHEQLHASHSFRFSHIFNLAYYVAQSRKRAIVSNFPLASLIVPLSDIPIPASTVLPNVPIHVHTLNRFGYSVPLSRPSVTIVGKTMRMYDPKSDKSWNMSIDQAKVLQGFTHSMDTARYTPVGLAKRKQMIGDAVPPPFSYAFSLAGFKHYHRHVRLPCDLAPFYTPYTHRTDDTTMVQSYDTLCNGVASGNPSHDLYMLLTKCISWTFVIRLDNNTYNCIDISDQRSISNLTGECMMFIDGIYCQTPFHLGTRALRVGRSKFILVRGVRMANTVDATQLNVFKCLSQYSVRYARNKFTSGINDYLREFTFSELATLYTISEHVEDRKLRARGRCILTKYCKFRFKCHPHPFFSFSMPSRFGIGRGIISKIIWCVIRKLHLPLNTLRFIMQQLTVSFTAQPSNKSILCNFRPYCKKWSPHDRWPCTCVELRTLLGIQPNDTDSHVLLPDNSSHTHALFSQCGGDFADVFAMNLNDIYEPPTDTLADELASGIRDVLSTVKHFACAMRQKHTMDFTDILKTDQHPLYIHDTYSSTASCVARTICMLGFTVDHECARLLESITSRLTPYPSNPLCTSARVYELQRSLRDVGIVSYCDKNGGMGSVCCPLVLWYALRSKLWLNTDYKRTKHNVLTLHVSLKRTFLSENWDQFSNFRDKGAVANEPFVLVKFKDRNKYRPILSAFHHCLKHTHSRISSALRVILLTIVQDGPLDANMFSTFDASTKFIQQWNTLCKNSPTNEPLIPDGYAGDISSMFDKLPGSITMKAVLWALDASLSYISRRYNLRSKTRRYVTLHLTDPDRHHIGMNYFGEDTVKISFDDIISVCQHYLFHSHFVMSEVYFLLVLGIPQGGSMSVPLSQVYMIYCEYMFHSSLYDYTRVSSSGVIRYGDLTEHGVLTLVPPTLRDISPDCIVLRVVFKRYADDCRVVVLSDRNRFGCITDRYINAYKHDCYIKPCELEDEHETPSFPFLQGQFHFHRTHCDALYVAKNFPSYYTHGTARLRNIQHYLSYCASPPKLRYAAVQGKFSEVEGFSSSDSARLLGVFTLLPDLVRAQYPTNIICRALHARHQRTNNRVWVDIIPLVIYTMRLLRATCTGD